MLARLFGLALKFLTKIALKLHCASVLQTYATTTPLLSPTQHKTIITTVGPKDEALVVEPETVTIPI